MTRKIVMPSSIGIKDENGIYMKQLPPKPIEEVSTIEGVDDIATLLWNTLTILSREVKNLSIESTNGKLPAASARDLVNYVKLLSELEGKEKDILNNLSQEELEKILKDKKNETK